MMGFLASKQEGQSKTRGELWQLGIPEPGQYEYVWEWMREIGLGERISWSELKAWSELSGIRPTPEECSMIIHLSTAWFNEYIRGSREKAAVPLDECIEALDG